MDKKAFRKPEIIETAKGIVQKVVCNNCLGRQFAKVSTGMTNRQRGEIIREFSGLTEPGNCEICNNLFKNLDEYAEMAIKKLKGIDFKTFVVGSKLSKKLLQNEENLWEDVGIEYCEPVKSEINREIGKIIEKKTGKGFRRENPDVLILFDLGENSVGIRINSVYIVGGYKKFVRNISQSKWDKYKESVEGIIGKPIVKTMEADGTAFHGAGREDVDARCLDWRPFAIEIVGPRKRKVDLAEVEKKIKKTKKVEVNKLKFGTKEDVRYIKKMRPDKTYYILIELEKPIENMEKLKTLIGAIRQKTPTRVLHRRADKMRKRKIKSVKWKVLGKKKIEMEVRGEAGFYAKEFVTGDNGRTRPSVAEVLGNPAKVLSLDVVKIHLKG